MSWSNVSKPSSTTYTNVNGQGREQYDQSSITFDEATIFYDGVNESMWTDVLKPTTGGQRIIYPGMATGLITPPTYATQHDINFDNWIKVPKPTT